MKQVSVDNLKENDILAFPILSHSGTVLIHADVALTEELIERAINLGVRTVYIKDEKEGIVRENTSDSDTARVAVCLKEGFCILSAWQLFSGLIYFMWNTRYLYCLS